VNADRTDETADLDLDESVATDTAVAEEEEKEAYRLTLDATIEDSGPCRKHIIIRVPREDIEHFYSEEVSSLADKAEVPGFRVGHVPEKLIEKRFRKELSAQVKQKVLVQSLEQVSEDHKLDPINEPDIDVEAIEIPDEGDFEFEFDVEVRPDFDLPDYDGLLIERPTGEISQQDVDDYQRRYLAQYGSRENVVEPAEMRDYATLTAEFRHNDRPLHKIADLKTQILPVLRFQDAELDGFDELMIGAQPGDTREAELTISTESENLEMRGETVQARFTVREVKRMKTPELTGEFLQRIGFEDEQELQDAIRSTLLRQVQFQQRQACRRQVLAKITQSADWELPEDLVLKQVENALRREVLEMQQAGYTSQDIRSRENEIRQRAVSNTQQALKEHFVLDKIATQESIEVTPEELDAEIHLMAMQRGESARRVRARLEKTGMDENLAAQIRERKAVDVVLAKAKFREVPMEKPAESRVAAVPNSVCGITDAEAEPEEDEENGGD
jgi:trigger factor